MSTNRLFDVVEELDQNANGSCNPHPLRLPGLYGSAERSPELHASSSRLAMRWKVFFPRIRVLLCSTGALFVACNDQHGAREACEKPEIWRIELGGTLIHIPQSFEPSFQGGNASEFRAKTESSRHFDYIYCQSATDEPINPRLIQVSGDLADFGWKTETENRVDELEPTGPHSVGIKLQLLSAKKIKFLDLDDDETRLNSAAGRFADTYNRLSAIVGDVDVALKNHNSSETQDFDIVKVEDAKD